MLKRVYNGSLFCIFYSLYNEERICAILVHIHSNMETHEGELKEEDWLTAGPLFRTQGSVFSYILASIANDGKTGSADRTFHVDLERAQAGL